LEKQIVGTERSGGSETRIRFSSGDGHRGPFFDRYNNHHRHSGIGMFTPADVHHGQAEKIIRRLYPLSPVSQDPINLLDLMTSSLKMAVIIVQRTRNSRIL
jgi:hypothetical protein